MKDNYIEQWEKLGESDPYWAVLADPKKKDGKWNRDDFFLTGEKEVHDLLLKVKCMGEEIKFGTVLDFGCGVGRLSRALSMRFKKVIAVDVSISMLNEAHKTNRHIHNIDFLHNPAEDLSVIPADSIDFIYSNIVLQHMPKNRQIIYIREFCRVLHPKGLIAIQTPAKCNLKSWKGWAFWIAGNNVLNIIRRVKYGPSGVMEVHHLPQKIVFETLEKAGMTVINVERYDSAGPAFESYMYFAKKANKANALGHE